MEKSNSNSNHRHTSLDKEHNVSGLSPTKTGFSADNYSYFLHFKKIMPFILIGVACFFGNYLLNTNTPPLGDDLTFKFAFQNYYIDTITPPRVTSFSQIFEGMIIYYKTFRGRVFAIGLDQVFTVYGKQYFDVLNSFVSTGITFLVYYHANFGKKANWRLFLTVCAVFWFLNPNLMTTSLWMAGSLCEFWVQFLVLLFLVPYRILVSGKSKVKHPILTTLFVVPTGFLAGAFDYLEFGMSVGFVVLAIVYVLIKKSKVPVWSVIGLISTVCGTLFILLAPASMNGLGESPLSVILENFPVNVFISIAMSITAAGELMLLTLIVFLWLFTVIRRTVLQVLFLVTIAGSLFNAIVLPYIRPSPFFMPDSFLLLPRLIFTLIISLVLFYLVWQYFRETRMEKRKLSKSFTGNKQQLKYHIHKKHSLIQCFLFVCMIGLITMGVKLLNSGGHVFQKGGVVIVELLIAYFAFLCIRLIFSVRKYAKTFSKKSKDKVRLERKTILEKFLDNQRLKTTIENKNGMLIPFLFLITAVASVVVALALPYHEIRLFFTVFISFALLFFSVLSEAIDRIKKSELNLKNAFPSRFLRLSIPIFLCLVTLCDFGKEYRIYHNHFVFYTNVVDSLEYEIAAGKKDLKISRNKDLLPYVLRGGRLTSPLFFHLSVTGVGDDPDAVTNKWIAYYLGADTIIVTE